MFYYEVATLGSSLKPLTYASKLKLDLFSVVSVNLRDKISKAVVLKECEKPSFETKEILEITGEKFTQTQISLANFISSYYICEKGVAFGIFTPYKSSNNLTINFEKTPNLSQNQTKALNFAKANNPSLIFGDTGSGKSEIYISYIIEVLNSGKQGLFLMPEISLTPQMQKRLEVYFKDSFAMWHSKITPKKKSQILENFSSGKIKLIAGARSAMFLPFTNLGIIVVDEEHDDSYKSAQKPRYNARDLAIFLASKFDIKLILGSATPSLTTICKQPYFRLKETYFKTQKEIVYDDSETEISPLIRSELKKTLKNQNQAIVFLPTRANFKYMICKKCSSVVKCPFCSVGMSFHRDKNALKCHYCGFMKFAKSGCEKCGSEILEAKRVGTSEVVSELQKLFPDKNIAKFDRDSITTNKKLNEILKSFNSKEIDILVGTQMLSKGHDYHNVRLAVVMGIDESLNYPDFRAREKTLALAIQLAGRAGRMGSGRVIIQTKQSEFFKEFLQNYDKFLEEEKDFRDGLYPPFTRLLRILISHKKDALAKKNIEICLERIKGVDSVQIIGYGKAGIEYIASKFRYEILLRSTTPKALVKCGILCADIAEIDMDPVQFS